MSDILFDLAEPRAGGGQYKRQRITLAYRNNLRPPVYLQKDCGYCATGSHEHCKRGIRSGDGHVMLCPCMIAHERTSAASIRCLECGNTDIDELDEKMWLCIEPEDCEYRINQRIKNDPNMQMIHQAYIDAAEKQAVAKANKPARNRNPSRPSSGECLCCGEKTAGGLFLPGHDARLVSMKGKEVAEGADPIQVLADFKAMGVSPALYAKLERKLEKM